MFQWKKIVVPLTKEDLARAESIIELEIGLEQVKREEVANKYPSTIRAVICENQTLAKSKRDRHFLIGQTWTPTTRTPT